MLPKITHPTHKIEIPSLKKKVSFRPFLVKEEKLLLMAKESEDPEDILTSIKQIVNNCCLDEKFNVNEITLFDLEYIFIQLRGISVDNIVEVSYRDSEDDKVYDFKIDIKDIKVNMPDKPNNVIKITDDIGIIMKYPPSTLYDDKEFLNSEDEHLFKLIIRCVDKIYQGDEVYEASSYSKEELSEFLEDLSVKVFEQIQKFFEETPKLSYTIKYKNSLDNKREIHLNSLNDFFTLR